MIGYYVHHHGRGHLTRARTLAGRLDTPVVALTSLALEHPHPFREVVHLDRDDASTAPRNPTAGVHCTGRRCRTRGSVRGWRRSPTGFAPRALGR